MNNDDWVTTFNLIDIIERRWGNITIDRFPSAKTENQRGLILDTYAQKQKE